jgi:hypothetical protein
MQNIMLLKWVSFGVGEKTSKKSKSTYKASKNQNKSKSD